jgi:hypothetical protein
MNCRHADRAIVEGGLGRDLLACRCRKSDRLFVLNTPQNSPPPPPSSSPCISTACRRRSGALWRRRCPAKRGASRHRCSANDAAAIVLTAPKAFDWLAAYPSLQIKESNSRQFLAENPRRPHDGRASGLAKDRARIEGENL